MRLFLLQVLVFLASFLIFQIELILGKWIVPGFGGGYLVWGITVVFYQGLLFLGYAYVHWANGRWPLGRLRGAQAALAALSLLCLPVNARRLADPGYHLPVVVEIILMLSLTIGALFFILSTLSVYLQVHLAASGHQARHNPYVLYAGSNLGAFAALLSYPFFWEPRFDLEVQLAQWQIGYGLVVVLFLLLLVLIRVEAPGRPHGHPLRRVEGPVLLKWLLLSAAPSALFLAITNEITLNIAPVPFLWILPLSIYLLTLVLCFKKRPFGPPALLNRTPLLLALGTLLFLFNLNHHSLMELFTRGLGSRFPDLYALGVVAEPGFLLALCFGLCLTCHHRLQEEKPAEPARLTSFYLVLSAGGFIGGLLVNWIAPLVFNVTLETLIAFLLAAWGLALGREAEDPRPRRTGALVAAVIGASLAWPALEQAQPKEYGLLIALGGVLILLGLLYLLGTSYRRFGWVLAALVLVVPFMDRLILQKRLIYKTRNYYGMYTVYEEDGFRKMKHGTTLHGAQFLDPRYRRVPATYYHPQSPMGQVLLRRPVPLNRLALIGLGVGSMALYTVPGDTWDYFEIDPEVGYIAQNFFPFLATSPGKINLIYGDARVSLRRQSPGRYQGLVIDVFNSGAIPVHLLTVEALQEYLRVLVPDGVMFFHVSNQFLDLIPVLYADSRVLGLHFSLNFSAENHPPAKEPTLWVALTPSEQAHRSLQTTLGWRTGKPRSVRPWTDRYTSLWPVLIR